MTAWSSIQRSRPPWRRHRREEPSAVRRMRQLELVSNVAVQISSVRAVDDVLWEVVRQAQAAFGYYYVHVTTVDRRRHVAVCRAGWDRSGPRRDLVGWSLRLRDQGLVGWVAWSGTPLLVTDVRQDARYYLDERFPDTRSELTVPIKRGDETIGVLDAQDREVGAFDSGDLLVLETLARQVSVALENADLFEQLAASQAQLEEKAQALDEFADMAAWVQEEDRRRIALDLHDGVVQLLVGARFEVETIRMVDGAPGPDATRQLQRVSEILNDCTTEMRRVVFDLYPPDLASLGLVPTLERYVATVGQLFKLRCNISVSGHQRRLAPHRELAAFRFSQEALANASKHADGASVQISLEFTKSALTITVADDGPGFDSASSSGADGFGLKSMQRNATRANGRFSIRSEPGVGTSVSLEIATEEAAA